MSNGLDAITLQVADAVRLSEGPAGVKLVLGALASLESPSVRALSRASGLPVPVVTAVLGELVVQGLVVRARPARLTEMGHELVGPGMALLACPACNGQSVAIPPALDNVVRHLEEIAALAPWADVTLDQSHCTAETKVRRALYILGNVGVIDGGILFLGDDDLSSLALALVAASLGRRRVTDQMTILDVDDRILEFLRSSLRDEGVDAHFVSHDVREPLPADLEGAFEVVLTDPPWTLPGARLFVSRAVSALRDGPGWTVLLCFSSKGPGQANELQQDLLGMGLSMTGLLPNFNEYVGAGIRGGLGHLYHLRSTLLKRPALTGRYEGPLYTGQLRDPARKYQCSLCGMLADIGPGRQWSTIGELRRSGCTSCGASTFKPLARG